MSQGTNFLEHFYVQKYIGFLAALIKTEKRGSLRLFV